MPSAPLHPHRIEQAGRILLWGGFGLALLGVLVAIWSEVPALLLLAPAVVTGGGVYALAARHPASHLVLVILGFVTVLGFDDGLQAPEALYAGYYIAYLGMWLISRLVWMRRATISTVADWAALGLLVSGTFAAIWGIALGNSVVTVLGEWIFWMFFGLYFPVKEVCVRYRWGLHIALGAFGFILVYVTIRNGFYFFDRFGSAEYAYEISRGRVVANDSIAMVSTMLGFAFLLYARSWKEWALWLGATGIFLASLILTQSRGYWVAFLVGAVAIFVVVPMRYRGRWVALVATAFVSVFGVGLLLFSDLFLLFISGVLDRFLSIGSSAQSDISLISRLYESAGVWKEIEQSPVLGQGLGATFTHFDIINQITPTRSFSHNGYLSVWFRLGLLGSVSLLVYWGAAIRNAVVAFRSARGNHIVQVTALFLGGTLTAFVLSANTSSPFYLSDTLFEFGVMGGLAAGIAARAKAAQTP